MKKFAALFLLLASPAFAQRAGNFGDPIAEVIPRYSPTSTVAWTSATSADTAITLDVRGYTVVAVQFRTPNPGTGITNGVVTFETSLKESPTTEWERLECYLDVFKTSSPGISLFTDPTNARCDVAGYKHFRVRLSTVITGADTANIDVAASSVGSSQLATVQNGGLAVHGVLADGGADFSSVNPVKIAGVDASNNVQNLRTGADDELDVDATIGAGDADIGNVDLEFAGTAASTGVGASGAQTLRAASLIHDGTDTALVSAAGSLAMDVAQVAGATAQSGSGNATGALRVELANNGTGALTTVGTVTNLTNLPNEGQQTAANSISVAPDTDNDAIGAIGAAPPGEVVQIAGLGSGATAGFLQNIIACDSWVPVDIVTATTVLAVTGVSGRHVYICSINLLSAGANNVAIVAGTGATCGTSTAGMNGGTTAAEGWNFAANGGIAQGNGLGSIMRTETTGDSVCIITSAAVQLSGAIGYAIF